MEKLVDVDDIRNQIERVLEDVSVRGDPVIVENHGKAVAAVVPLHIYEQWKRERDEFLHLLHKAQQSANLSDEEAMEIALEAVAAVRAEMRAERRAAGK